MLLIMFSHGSLFLIQAVDHYKIALVLICGHHICCSVTVSVHLCRPNVLLNVFFYPVVLEMYKYNIK